MSVSDWCRRRSFENMVNFYESELREAQRTGRFPKSLSKNRCHALVKHRVVEREHINAPIRLSEKTREVLRL